MPLLRATRIWLVNFSGIDSIRISPTDPAKNDPDGERIAVSYKGWRSSTGLNWQHLYGERGVGLFGISHSEAHVNQSVKDVGRYGLPEAETPLLYREDSAEGESTVKYDLTTYMAGLAKVQAGGSFKAFRIRYDTAQPFGADGLQSSARSVIGNWPSLTSAEVPGCTCVASCTSMWSTMSEFRFAVTSV